MILVTGGLGFIGLHTARAIIDCGEDVVLTQFRVAREPDFIKGEIGKHAFVEQLDVTDAERLAEIGKKYPITKIAHLAVPAMNALSASQDFRTNMFGLINLLEAAETWGVDKIGIASSGTVYGGTSESPQQEDVRVPLVGNSPTEAFKSRSRSSAATTRLGPG
jgi:UDP-glucose 4-epimerase